MVANCKQLLKICLEVIQSDLHRSLSTDEEKEKVKEKREGDTRSSMTRALYLPQGPKQKVFGTPTSKC